MSVVQSSSSSDDDDFAAFLDLELDQESDDPPNIGEVEEEEGEKDKRKQEVEECEDLDFESKRQKIEMAAKVHNSPAMDICDHPAAWKNICVLCGERREKVESDVPLGYIYQNFTLNNEEADRLREKDLKHLLSRKKLNLVLDLDHTLLNSALLIHLNEEEKEYIAPRRCCCGDFGKPEAEKKMMKSLHRLDKIGMATKLRPFVHTFLEEASKLFEMYIYTMGDRQYALAMADLLDPKGIYFQSRVISNENNTKKNEKNLDVVLGKESAVLILDDTEKVWKDHNENLILMDRYHFFSSSLRHFQHQSQQSLFERKSDENESDGALATVLKVLQKTHSDFFDEKQKDNPASRDVRQVLGNVRKEVLKDCNIVFSRVFPKAARPENQEYWKLAEQLGATCVTETDSSVTHVISRDAGTEKSRWAVREEKFLVNPDWINAARYLWKRQPEASFPVSSLRNA